MYSIDKNITRSRGDKKRLVPCLHALVLFQQWATRGNKGCAVQPDESLLTIMDGPKKCKEASRGNIKVH